MNKGKEEERPAILIYTSPGARRDFYEEMLYGIEEEGLPYRIIENDLNDACALAVLASGESLLVAGIGIDSEKIVLHHEKMSKSEYLFSIDMDDDRFVKREMGECAARLVKKTPFKNLYIKEDIPTGE